MKLARAFGMGALSMLGVLAVGCGAKKPAVSDLQRKEAAHLATEAQFAMSLRDYARAEASLARAAGLAPDEAGLWVSLGAVRMKLGNKDQARDAYKRALALHVDEAKENKSDPEPWLKQVYVLALLGRKDEGRAMLDRAAKQFPDSRNVKLFIENKQFDRMLSDPQFKEMGL